MTPILIYLTLGILTVILISQAGKAQGHKIEPGILVIAGLCWPVAITIIAVEAIRMALTRTVEPPAEIAARKARWQRLNARRHMEELGLIEGKDWLFIPLDQDVLGWIRREDGPTHEDGPQCGNITP